jgi:hypothetical protein
MPQHGCLAAEVETKQHLQALLVAAVSDRAVFCGATLSAVCVAINVTSSKRFPCFNLSVRSYHSLLAAIAIDFSIVLFCIFVEGDIG